MVTIGVLARDASISVDTVRHDEKRGLVSPSVRTAAGYRLYDAEQIARLAFVRRAKQCGFTLREIERLLGYRDAPEVDRKIVRGYVRRKREQLIAQSARLQAFADELDELAEICQKDGRGECPILCRLRGEP